MINAPQFLKEKKDMEKKLMQKKKQPPRMRNSVKEQTFKETRGERKEPTSKRTLSKTDNTEFNSQTHVTW